MLCIIFLLSNWSLRNGHFWDMHRFLGYFFVFILLTSTFPLNFVHVIATIWEKFFPCIRSISRTQIVILANTVPCSLSHTFRLLAGVFGFCLLFCLTCFVCLFILIRKVAGGGEQKLYHRQQLIASD